MKPTASTSSPGWAKIPQAAQYAGMSPRTIRYWMKKGLRHSRLPSGAVLIRYEDIDAFLGRYATTSDQGEADIRRVCEALQKRR